MQYNMLITAISFFGYFMFNTVSLVYVNITYKSHTDRAGFHMGDLFL